MATNFFQNIPISSLSVAEKPEKSISVNFTNRGLQNVFKTQAAFKESTPDKINILNISRVLGDLKVEKDEPVGFKSIPEFVGIDYLGYIIEKQRLSKKTGKWIPIDEYWLIGSATANFKDSRIAYGNVYRYRMKSVVSVTYKKKKVSYETLELIEDVRRQEKELIKTQLQSRLIAISNIDRITNLGLESKLSSGVASTTYDLLKNLQITSNAGTTEIAKSTVSVTSTYTDLRQLKNLRVQDLGIMRGSITQQELQKQVNSKLKTIEEDIIEYESFYYESRPTKNWLIVDVSEKIPPPPPSAIKITPNSTKGTISITWLSPANNQRDISGFRLYHKTNLDKRWRMVKEFPVEENVFERSFNTNKKHIFALVSLDVHRMESFLSTQIQAEFNPNFAVEKKEKPLKWISGSGAKPSETDTIFKTFIKPQDPIVAKKSVKFSVKPQFNEENKKLFVRITSLDTHEKKEFNLTLKNINLSEIER